MVDRKPKTHAPETSAPQSSAPQTSARPAGAQVTRAGIVGPGIVVAATGVGAGTPARQGGALYGLPLLWTVALGALLKFGLAEGVARWQLATGTTILEGVDALFWLARARFLLIYLVIWTVIVSAALMAACGLAAHALFPFLRQCVAVIHALIALFFTGQGLRNPGKGDEDRRRPDVRRHHRQRCTPVAARDGGAARHDRAVHPGGLDGLGLAVYAVLGPSPLSCCTGCARRGWRTLEAVSRFDLAADGLLSLALRPKRDTARRHGPETPRTPSRQPGRPRMAMILGEDFDVRQRDRFIVGFLGRSGHVDVRRVAGRAYHFGNYVGLLRGARPRPWERAVSPRGRIDRGYALGMTFPPMLLLLFGKPVWLAVAYTAVGALFIPFRPRPCLMNNRREIGGLRRLLRERGPGPGPGALRASWLRPSF